MTTATKIERTREEIEAENLFLLSMLNAGVTHESPIWAGKASVALLVWSLLDLKPASVDIPYAEYEFDQVERMFARAPAHLQEIMRDKMEAMKEQMRVKIEDRERDRLRNSRSYYS